ncbi:MAG: hypothetical protein B6247_17255 [Candidatus Parabeggiatoa sp. nov. 2]|nr:MAG: hypothetical protein B6247_17255 [Beggiatoa sp. 4572_84]
MSGTKTFITRMRLFIKNLRVWLTLQFANINNEPTSRKSVTDWWRLDAMSDENIEHNILGV